MSWTQSSLRESESAYRKRNVVERLVNRLKQFRRVATRYEKRAISYLAMLTITAIVLWLREWTECQRLEMPYGRA